MASVCSAVVMRCAAAKDVVRKLEAQRSLALVVRRFLCATRGEKMAIFLLKARAQQVVRWLLVAVQ